MFNFNLLTIHQKSIKTVFIKCLTVNVNGNGSPFWALKGIGLNPSLYKNQIQHNRTKTAGIEQKLKNNLVHHISYKHFKLPTKCVFDA